MGLYKLLLCVMLGHNTLIYLQDYIFLNHSNSNLGSLFYTSLRCTKFYRIGPRFKSAGFQKLNLTQTFLSKELTERVDAKSTLSFSSDLHFLVFSKIGLKKGH